MELAIALETIDRDTKDLQDQNSQSTVNYQKELTIQKKPVITPSGQPNKCHRCGGAHFASECRFKEFICHSCKKRGHLARCCRTRIQRAESTNVIKEEQEFEHVQQREDSYTLFSLGKDQKNDPILVTVFLNGQIIEMQLDTGASVSIISETTYKSLWSQPPKLSSSNVKLHTYTGEAIAVLGNLEVEVVYKHQRARLPLLVAKGKGPSLIGRVWLQTLRLDWKEINAIYKSKSDLDVLLEQYSDVFGSQLGELQGIEADIQVDCQAVPKFHKPRSVPYILKDKIEKELDRLLVTDVIERVSFSKWAAPVVAVTKSDGSVRLCGDYKLTVNPVSLLDQYPLPRVEDLFAQLSGGKTFTKLDLSHAYHQLKLSPESRDLTTINTHKGLFRYKRLPFGVSSAPAIFQRTMETLLQGLNHVTVYIDDILVTGTSYTDHLHNLQEVLKRLHKAGARLRKDKCSFMSAQVKYLGYVIDERGLHPNPERVKAIVEAPTPRSTSELKSFLGLLNYYRKFLPNLSALLSPLHSLLQASTKWSWTLAHTKAFEEAKRLLSSSKVLVHFDPAKRVVLSCDASARGLGAVLAHLQNDGSEQPIAYTSRSLAPAEKNYSQLDREALAIVFAVKKFHPPVSLREEIYIIHGPQASSLPAGRGSRDP